MKWRRAWLETCKSNEKRFAENCDCASHSTVNVSTFINAYLVKPDMSSTVAIEMERQ